MKDYLLIIDTETTGLPKKWNRPYSTKDNWPCSIQIAWIVCDRSGSEIKRENHYIFEEDFSIDISSIKVHGITHEFLKKHGVRRKYVMRKLAYDIKKYDPMLVSHFAEFDFHMLSADFFRSKISTTIDAQPFFCTMLASKNYVHNPSIKLLKLKEFYEILFDETVENIHNAIVDAEAATRVFFELLRRGEVNSSTIERQQFSFRNINPVVQERKWWTLLLPF